MKLKKLAALLMVSAMTASLLAGCGSKGSDSGSKDKGDEVTLKTVSMFGGTDPNAKPYQEINKKLMEDNKNISIEDDSQASDEEWKAKVAADFSAGNEPDVLQFFTDATAQAIVATDKLMSIEDIRKEYPEYAKNIDKNMLSLTQNRDGVERAVPTTGYWEGLYCNKELFDKYKVELPTDWDSLVTAVKTFKKNGIIPVAVSLNNVPHYWTEFAMYSAAGKDGYTQVPDKAPAEWVKGLESLKELRELGAFPEDTDTVDDPYAQQLFNDKKAAMELDGSWRTGSIPDQDTTVIVRFPGVKDGKDMGKATVGGVSSGFYITKKAWDDPKKRDAAVKFVMAHTSDEGIQKYWEAGGGIAPAAVKVEPMKDMTPLAKAAFEFNNEYSEKVAPTDARIDPEAYKTLVAGIVGVTTGDKSAEDLLNEVLKLNKDRSE